MKPRVAICNRPWVFSAAAVLRLAFAIRCFGLGAKYLWSTFETESPVFSWLLFDLKWPQTFAQRADDLAIWMMVLAGIAVLAGPFFSSPRFARCVSGLLVWALIWELLVAGCATYRGGEFLSGWTIPEHGLRIMTPWILFWMQARPERCAGEGWLRFAVALTFAAHGYKAGLNAPVFVTMIIASSQNCLDYWPEQSMVLAVLKIICVLDWIVAIGILIVRWPAVALYATIWGLITAVARWISISTDWPEVLIRAVHVGGPLALYLQWKTCRPSSRRSAECVNQTDTGSVPASPPGPQPE